MSYILNISPKGQITIPAKERKQFRHKKCLVEKVGNTLVIKPIEIKVIENDSDESKNFGHLAESSLKFWNDPEEDIWDTFYD